MFIKWALTADSWLFAHREDCGNRNMRKQFCILSMNVLTDLPSDFVCIYSMHVWCLRRDLDRGVVGWVQGETLLIKYQFLKVLATSLFIDTCTLITVDVITHNKGCSSKVRFDYKLQVVGA